MPTNEPKWLWEGQTIHWEQLAHLAKSPSHKKFLGFTRFAAKTRMVELMLKWLDSDEGQQWILSLHPNQITAQLLMARASEVFGWGLGKPPNSKARMLSRESLPQLSRFNALLGDY